MDTAQRTAARRRAESDHHPVAGAPELAPAGRADRLAQYVEVLVPQLVRANRADGIRQPRRTDEVGHQNRRRSAPTRLPRTSRGGDLSQKTGGRSSTHGAFTWPPVRTLAFGRPVAVAISGPSSCPGLCEG
jgi:hypothetical protein